MIQFLAAEQRIFFPSLLLVATISVSISLLCFAATGTSLGLYFAGAVLVTILLPPLTLIEDGAWRQAVVASVVNDSVGVVWLGACLLSETTLWQWLQSYFVLTSYSFALWGLARAAVAVRLHAILASAFTTTAGLLWLSWPVWLARQIVQANSEALISWLIPPHPLFALNGVLKHLGIWSQSSIAYNYLLNLGQDVPYLLPDSIVPAVFVHLILGGSLCAIASIRRAGSRLRHLTGEQ